MYNLFPAALPHPDADGGHIQSNKIPSETNESRASKMGAMAGRAHARGRPYYGREIRSVPKFSWYPNASQKSSQDMTISPN